MIRFETEQTTARSAEKVWTYAADILRHPEWMGVTDGRIVEGTGTEVGARAIERIRMGPRIVDVEGHCCGVDPGQAAQKDGCGSQPVDG